MLMNKPMALTIIIITNYAVGSFGQEASARSMYVCLCNGITDKQIRAAIDRGARSITHLQDELGVATQCGSCLEAALSMMTSPCDPGLAEEAVLAFSAV